MVQIIIKKIRKIIEIDLILGKEKEVDPEKEAHQEINLKSKDHLQGNINLKDLNLRKDPKAESINSKIYFFKLF